MDILQKILTMIAATQQQGKTPLEILVPAKDVRDLVAAMRVQYQKDTKGTSILLVGQTQKNLNEVGIRALQGVPVLVSLGDELSIRWSMPTNPFGNRKPGVPERVS